MTCGQSTISRVRKQPPRGGYGFLAAVLDDIEDGSLLDALAGRRRTGRPGYPLRAMWRAYLCKFVLKIRYNVELLERLRGSPRLRGICGFTGAIPSESAFSRFVSRLAGHQNFLENCFAGVTSLLRGLLPTGKPRSGRPEEPPPPLGEVVAVDSTAVASYGNPNRKRVSDPDARWGLKHSARTKDGKQEWNWGYKLHLIADATHGLPLGFIVTPANKGDSPLLPALLRKARDTYDWLQPRYLLADKGYDALSNHQALVKQGIVPVIHLRRPQEGKLHGGIYSEDGSPTCLGQVAMEYARTDPETGHHLFRCPPEGCPLKAKSNGAWRHCDSEVWEDPQDNLRVIGLLPRSSKLWKKLYQQRMSIERIFRSLKHSRGLEGHTARGLRKITLQAIMSLLTYQATSLARLRAGDLANMRRMRVKAA